MIKALIFDLNGTVIDILTDEGRPDLYRVTANFLEYQGVDIAPDELRELYFAINKRQRRDSGEDFPEFDAAAIFAEIIAAHGSAFTRALPKAKRQALPEIATEVFRAASRFKLEPYPGVIKVLDRLRPSYRLAALSDGQSLWAKPELRAAGLDGYFEKIMVSGDFGFRKPDRRFFQMMLDELGLKADEVLFVGNDMYRDVYGAARLGIKTVFFKSNQGEQRPSGAEPDYIIYNFGELPEAIRFLTGRTG